MNKKDSDNMTKKNIEDRTLSTRHLNKEQRKEYALETTRMVQDGKITPTNQLAKSNYLDNPSTREFHAKVRNKSLLTKRTCLNSPEQFTKEVVEYFDLCDEYKVTPVVIGLANYLSISKRHFYELLNNGSDFSPIAQKALDSIAEMQEDAALRNAINSVAWIFTAKNHLGYTDNQTVTLKPDNSATDRSQTMEALRLVAQEQKLLENNQK